MHLISSITTCPAPSQLSVMRHQLHLAQRLHRPISLHCVSAFGPLLDSLKRVGSLPHGCLLHSYSGSPDLVLPLARAGAYFSFSARAVSMARPKLVATLRQVPPGRLLLESDAPDGLPVRWEGGGTVMSVGEEGYGHREADGRGIRRVASGEESRDSLRPGAREEEEGVGGAEEPAQMRGSGDAGTNQPKQAQPVNHPANVLLVSFRVRMTLLYGVQHLFAMKMSRQVA